MDEQQTDAPILMITHLPNDRGIVVDWGVGDGTLEEFIAVVEQELLVTIGQMILLRPESKQEPSWALAILIEMALLTDYSPNAHHPDVGIWDWDRKGFVIITNWGDGQLERGSLVLNPEKDEEGQGPCYYCGQLTSGRTDAGPSWNYSDPEPSEMWFCGSEECQEAYGADPYMDWSAYWASL